jgi:chromosome segregation ATPase
MYKRDRTKGPTAIGKEIMKVINKNQKLMAITAVAMISSALVLGDTTFALTAQQTATQQARLQAIISKGDQEISRRLSSLNTLTAKINAATKLTATSKAALGSEVTTEISGLTALKSKLDAETTLANAKVDAQQIYTDYRVYALIVPKVHLVKLADDIQAVDAKLTTLAGKLQSRIATAQQAGKDVAALQSQLADMNSKISAAQNAASQIESSVINLQPSDYNSNHQVLSGDMAQLKTAHIDNQAAFTDAKNIVSALKNLR